MAANRAQALMAAYQLVSSYKSNILNLVLLGEMTLKEGLAKIKEYRKQTYEAIADTIATE